MNEATLQMIVTYAMKDICREQQRKMRVHAPSSNQQRPNRDNSYPYDVGVLIDGAYLIGLEFKVQSEGIFPSWNKEQHETYLGLTGSRSLELPLYYAYNASKLNQLEAISEDHRSAEVLQQSRISTPKELPGKSPSISEHQDMHTWLISWLEDVGKSGKNGWTSIRVGTTPLLEDMLTGFPDIVWLLAVNHEGGRLCWVLTNDEIRVHLDSLRHIWNRQNLGSIGIGIRTEKAYLEAISKISNYIDQAITAHDNPNNSSKDNRRTTPRSPI